MVEHGDESHQSAVRCVRRNILSKFRLYAFHEPSSLVPK